MHREQMRMATAEVRCEKGMPCRARVHRGEKGEKAQVTISHCCMNPPSSAA